MGVEFLSFDMFHFGPDWGLLVDTTHVAWKFSEPVM